MSTTLHGRQLLTSLLRGEMAARPALVPFVDTLAARVAGNSYREMLEDPGLWTSALIKCAGLLEADGVIAGYEPTVMAEALGATIGWNNGRPVLTGQVETVPGDPLSMPRLAAAVETSRRIAAPAGRDLACIAAVTGPQLLAAQVFGPREIESGARRIRTQLAAIAEAFLKTQPDLILFIEQFDASGGALAGSAARIYGTLRNLAAYYNVPTAVYAEGYDPGVVEDITALKVDVYVLGRDCHGGRPDLAAALALAGKALAVGIGLPFDAPDAVRVLIEAARVACRDGHKLLLTSLGAIAGDTDLYAAKSRVAGLRGD